MTNLHDQTRRTRRMPGPGQPATYRSSFRPFANNELINAVRPAGWILSWTLILVSLTLGLLYYKAQTATIGYVALVSAALSLGGPIFDQIIERWRQAGPAARQLSVVLTVVSLDWVGFWRFGPPWRYVAIPVIIAISLAGAGIKINRAHSARALMAPVLALTVIAATLAVAIVSQRTLASTLILWLPMLLIMTAILHQEKPSAASLKADISLLRAAASIYTISALTSSLADRSIITHEASFIPASLCILAFLTRSYMLGIGLIAATVAAFINYPALTFLIAAGLATFWWATSRLRRSWPIVVGIVLTGYLLSTEILEDLAGDYLNSSGKGNNTQTREYLWRQAYDQIVSSPFLGNNWGGVVTGMANINGRMQPAPFHNTLLAIAVAGGLVALSAFLLVATWALVAARNSRFIGRPGIAKLNPLPVTAGAAVLCCLGTTLFNPILESLPFAISFYAFAALAYAYSGFNGSLEPADFGSKRGSTQLPKGKERL